MGRGTLWEGQVENCLHQNHIFRIRADRSQLEQQDPGPRFPISTAPAQRHGRDLLEVLRIA